MPTKNRMQTSRPPIILAECSHDAVRRTPRVVVLSLPLLNTKTPYMPARKNHSTRRINGKNAQQNNGRHMPSQGERTEYMLSSTQPMKRCPKKKKKAQKQNPGVYGKHTSHNHKSPSSPRTHASQTFSYTSSRSRTQRRVSNRALSHRCVNRILRSSASRPVTRP